MMRSKMILSAIMGLSLCGTIVMANTVTPEKVRKPPKSGLARCVWQVETANREVTADCSPNTFVVSGGCRLDEGSFREGFPENVTDNSPVTEGTGWTCETTANQPITAAALCCPISK